MEQLSTLSDMWLIVPVLLTLHVIVCLLLVLVVLMQLPRSEGLGAAFGGTVTDNIFGAQTTHVLAKFTVWLGVAFFAITLMLAIAYSRRETGRTRIQQELMNAAAPSASATAPAPSAAVPAASPETAVPATSPETAVPAASPETAVPAASPETAMPAASPAAAP